MRLVFAGTPPFAAQALGALQAAAELSAKYINDRHLPDKAIDVIDEAGAAQRILPKSKQKKTITRAEVEEIVAKIARIPTNSVSSDDRSKLKTLDREAIAQRIRGGAFKDTVFGDVNFAANGQMQSRTHAFTVQDGRISRIGRGLPD